MTKKKALLAVLLLAVMAFGCALFAACGAKKYDISWDIDSHLTVTEITVNDEKADQLPASAKADTTITFKLNIDAGYAVDKYEGVTVRSGVYTLKVKEEAAAVKITAKKVVNSITATGLAKTDYVAGDSLDVTGLVVTATYADDTSAAIPKKEGTGNGYTVSPATFEGGETEVTISYEGKTTTIPVTVDYKVTINLNGGQLNDETAYEDLNNFSYDKQNGVVTFSYLNLEEGKTIVLPTADDITRTGYKLTGWEGDEITSITAETAQNITLKANWEYAGVTVNSANIVVEGEGASAKPYVVVTGEFNDGVTSVALYLRDSGDDTHSAKTIEYGTVSKSADSNQFTAKLDLTKLSAEESLFDRWMDIRLGDPANNNIYESLQIYTNDIDEIENRQAFVNGYNYLFKSYSSKGDPTLKVYFNDAMYTFEVVTVDGSDGKDVSIKFEGFVNNEACYGGKISISWYINGNDPNDSSTIGPDGSFSITLTTSKVAVGTIGYAHVVITDSKGTTVVGAKETNLVSSACNNLADLEEQFVIDGNGNKMISAVKATSADGLVYYVGNSFWDGILIYVRNEKVLFKEATLRVDNVPVAGGDTADGEEAETPETPATQEVVHLVLSGSYSTVVYKTVAEAETAIKTNLRIDAQALSTWAQVTDEYTPEVVVNADGTFEILIRLDKAEAGQTVFFHKCFGFNGDTTTSNNNLSVTNAAPKIGDNVTSGGLTYTIGDASKLGEEWQQSLIIVNVTAAATQD